MLVFQAIFYGMVSDCEEFVVITHRKLKLLMCTKYQG